MNYSSKQKEVVDSVIAIFETGKVPTASSYGTCSILADGAGISYGKHQCTDKAGSLDLVCKKYIALGGGKANDLSQYLAYLATNESSKVKPGGPYPEWLSSLIALLKSLGSDTTMQTAQDFVFDQNYFQPAVNIANEIGLTTALGLLVIHDTCIHSGPGGVANIRSRFPEASPANGGDEKAWISAYIAARRNWLAGNKNTLVQKTVYRMDSLAALVKSGNWDLNTPLTVRNVKIS